MTLRANEVPCPKCNHPLNARFIECDLCDGVGFVTENKARKYREIRLLERIRELERGRDE